MTEKHLRGSEKMCDNLAFLFIFLFVLFLLRDWEGRDPRFPRSLRHWLLLLNTLFKAYLL